MLLEALEEDLTACGRRSAIEAVPGSLGGASGTRRSTACGKVLATRFFGGSVFGISRRFRIDPRIPAFVETVPRLR
jgi:hypothetical protein